ncbi:helix-turn-helix domain-containing protein, partial [Bacillus mycoides]|uniref:helix-turn-helix domain-containing protein n=2 Tax=Bacillus TaxID=1386 RepID=UPI002E1F5D5E|nr:helix-turn-helix domain-containing protein [Bacillus mycoides]
REQLENVLIDLEKEKVISHWAYTKDLDETQFTKKYWFENYYSQLGIVILPPEELINSVGKMKTRKNIDVIQGENQIVKINSKPLNTDENEKLIREKLVFFHTKKNIKMRELSEEIDISQPTLSRFYNRKTKRLSENARDKLSHWYNRQIIIEKM